MGETRERRAQCGEALRRATGAHPITRGRLRALRPPGSSPPPSTDMARPKKNPASVSPAKLRPAPAKKVKKPENVARHLVFVFLAAVLAGVATYLSRRLGHGGASRRHHTVTFAPESYAVCTEPGLVYTVDEHRPNVDCLLVNKDRIAATGSLGALPRDFLSCVELGHRPESSGWNGDAVKDLTLT